MRKKFIFVFVFSSFLTFLFLIFQLSFVDSIYPSIRPVKLFTVAVHHHSNHDVSFPSSPFMSFVLHECTSYALVELFLFFQVQKGRFACIQHCYGGCQFFYVCCCFLVCLVVTNLSQQWQRAQKKVSWSLNLHKKLRLLDDCSIKISTTAKTLSLPHIDTERRKERERGRQN